MMALTLWNEFKQNEGTLLANTIASGNVLIAMRLKVTTFGYLSLSARLSTCLLINPPREETNSLKAWYNVHRRELVKLVEDAAYKDSNKLLPPPREEDIIDTESAINTLKDASVSTSI